nr:BTAD domain-containing putative transcriptional regulator [Dactylosporangium thailandense]
MRSRPTEPPLVPVRVCLLGAVSAHTPQGPLHLGPRQQRLLLAILALEANRHVSVDRIVDLMWPAAPPRTARHAVRVCASGLRAAFAPVSAADAAIVAVGGGYALRIDPMAVDAQHFRTLLGEADTETSDQRRLTLLDQSLALWRGTTPLADAAQPDVRDRLGAGLTEARLRAVEDRFDIRLRLGQHARLLDELADACAAHPARERLAGQLMLALYRCGRGAEGLAVYHRLRDHLAEQFGLDPGPALRGLERQILQQDPALERHPAPRRPPVPAQLPAMAGLVGREPELAQLDALARNTEQDAAGTSIAVITGTAGVGKTALAVRWGHTAAARFPDGQLHVNLRGFDPSGPALDPAAVLRAFLNTLGVPAQQIPSDPDERAAVYRSTIAGRRLLIVLDNARHAEQVRPLLPGAASCLTVVTSRDPLRSLVAIEGATPLVLGLLTVEQSRDLLTSRIGGPPHAAEPLIDEIVERCARLPLALAVAAARITTRRHLPLAEATAELRDASTVLDALDGGDPVTDLRAVLSWSYLALGRDAARLLRLLGTHPGADIGELAAASLAGLPTVYTRSLLAELVSAHLVSEHTAKRYVLHDLLKAYAAEQSQATDSAEERRAAMLRLADHYLHTAHPAARLLDPLQVPITLTARRDDVVAEPPGHADAALAWFRTEHESMAATAARAAALGLDEHAWRLVWTLTSYLLRQGHWQAQRAAGQVAADAARRLGDRGALAHSLHGMGMAHARSGQHDEAAPLLRQALDLFTSDGDVPGQTIVLEDMAWGAEAEGDAQRGLALVERALVIAETAGHTTGLARLHNAIGWFHTLLGRHTDAVNHCEQALAMFQQVDDPPAVAATWDTLGHAHRHLGDHERATRCYRNAIGFYQTLGDLYNEAATLVELGHVLHESGQPDHARQAWWEAYERYEQLGHPDARQIADLLQPAAGR